MTEALSNLFKYKQFGNTGFKIFEVALFLNHEEDYTLARLEKTFVKNKQGYALVFGPRKKGLKFTRVQAKRRCLSQI